MTPVAFEGTYGQAIRGSINHLVVRPVSFVGPRCRFTGFDSWEANACFSAAEGPALRVTLLPRLRTKDRQQQGVDRVWTCSHDR
jgi:hypothetical protein